MVGADPKKVPNLDRSLINDLYAGISNPVPTTIFIKK